MSEGRRKQRFSLQMLIELSYNKENFIDASGIDISSVGIGCKSGNPLSLSNTYLMMKLFVDGNEEIIECEGMVIYSRKSDDYYRSGINFTDFKDSGKEKLDKFLKSYEAS